MHTLTVLVVEDEPLLRFTLESYLRQRFGRLLLAASSAEAMKLLHALDGTLDLLITDVLLTGLAGPDLASEVQRRFPGTAIVYMSGLPRRELLSLGIVGEASATIEKPFSPEGLARAVRDAFPTRRIEMDPS